MRLPLSVSRAALRLKPLVPVGAWADLLELASMFADAPTIGLPRLKRVLVLAPHPDDETIGCGGTIARLADQGARVEVVIATDGEATIGPGGSEVEIARRRRAEAREACALLGVSEPVFLGLPDGGVEQVAERAATAVQAVVDDLDPEVVLTPWLLDSHRDHQALTRSLARATMARGVEVWGYEAHLPLTATRIVPIDGVVHRKREALRAHRTAALALDLDATLGLNRWRSLASNGGVGHAEAFHAVPFDEFQRLVQSLAAS